MVRKNAGGTSEDVKRAYKSPQRKLVIFFEKSRNQWKAKCREAKILVRRFKNRARWLEQSRDRWKHRAQAVEAELKQLKAEHTTVCQSTPEPDVGQKKKPPPSRPRV